MRRFGSPFSICNAIIMITLIKKISQLAVVSAFVALSPLSAMAQGADDSDIGVFPPQVEAQAPEYVLSPGMDTHPMIRLTPDKSEIVNLDTEVKSMIVGNPLHLNVIMDTTKRLVLVPRSPGATSFTALDETGKVIMQRHVIVNGPEEKYVRIRRSCDAARAGGASVSNCEDMSVYYCPEGLCHPIEMITSGTFVTGSQNSIISPGTTNGGAGGMNKANAGDFNDNFDGNGAANPFDLLMKALQDGASNSQSGE